MNKGIEAERGWRIRDGAGMKNWERRRRRKSEGDIDDTYTFPGILYG